MNTRSISRTIAATLPLLLCLHVPASATPTMGTTLEAVRRPSTAPYLQRSHMLTLNVKGGGSNGATQSFNG
jgi:hypothetical protein